ncbi:MAG: hypothetical protein ACKN9U_11155, partial [Pirellulaceae bacterium]
KKEPAPEVRSEWVRHPQLLFQGQASKKRFFASHDPKLRPPSTEEFTNVFGAEAASWEQKRKDSKFPTKVDWPGSHPEHYDRVVCHDSMLTEGACGGKEAEIGGKAGALEGIRDARAGIAEG